MRRWRAERQLRRDFQALRGRVLAAVRRRLGARASSLPDLDLDACYAQAWQGLYAAILEGTEIANPAGWLVVVTHRRALDELRVLSRVRVGAPAQDAGQERDLAAELDERARLRELLEGLRLRLSPRERQAAVLCFLQGLSRAQAAAHMGMSERAFRRLMEGRGAAAPGVVAKMGALVETVGEGRWCHQQGSLMRALAFGVLDRDGERYALALEHSTACPACRFYVASLRGLAAALPGVLLPRVLLHGPLARLMRQPGLHVAAGRGAELGGGAGATGLAGGGAAAAGSGGGWLLTGGSLSAKLAAGCVLALGIGGGCVGLLDPSAPRPHPARRVSPTVRHLAPRIAPAAASAVATGAAAGKPSITTDTTNLPRSAASERALAAAQAQREFGIEQPAGPGDGEPRSRDAKRRGAYAASRQAVPTSAVGETRASVAQAEPLATPAAEAQAQREFGPE